MLSKCQFSILWEKLRCPGAREPEDRRAAWPQSPNSVHLLQNTTDGQPRVWGVRIVLVKWGCKKIGGKEIRGWTMKSSQFCVQTSTENSSVLVCCTVGLAGVWWGTISLPTPVAFMTSLSPVLLLHSPTFPCPNWGFPGSDQQYLQSLSSVQMLFSWNELELDVSKMTYPSIILFGIGQEIPQLLKTNRFPMQWCETSSSPQPPSLFFPNNREEWRKPLFKLLFLIRLKRCRGLLTSWSIMDVDSEEQVVSPHFSLSNAFRYYIFVGPNICKTFGAVSHSPWG